MRTLFSYFFVRLTLYGAIIALIFLFKFPQLLEVKKIENIKKTPTTVKVRLVAPPKIKKPKVKKIVKPKPKPKPKKKIKPKPKPKKIIKPKAKPKFIEKPVVKITPPDVNTTKPIKKEIKKVEPVIELPAEVEEPMVEQLSFEEENKIKLYEEYLRNMIYSKKKYPTKARRMRHQGSVKVRFVIDENGKILEHEIIKSSGYSTLDKATMRLFERIDTFEVPPEKLQTPYEFSIALKYELK